MIRKISTLFAALALSLGMMVATGEAAAAYGTPDPVNYATCQSGVTAAYYPVDADPRDCHTYYRLYHNHKLVLSMDNSSNPDVWNRWGRGYRAAQDWCANNSMTCGVMTGIGFMIVSPIISSMNA